MQESMNSVGLVHVHFLGGLGNQLFELLAAADVAWTNDVPLITTSKLGYQSGHYRQNRLDIFNLLTVEDEFIKGSRNQSETHHFTHCPVVYTAPITTVSGFRQHRAYFDKRFCELYNYVGLRNLVDYTHRQQFNLDSNRVVIHIRRGDYVNLKHYALLDIHTYYMSAIQTHFSSSTDIFILSDECSHPDIHRLQHLLVAKGKRVTIVHSKNEIDDFRMLATISKHMILSNSTFAWWAAYIRTRLANIDSNIKVILPDRWMQVGNKDSKYATPEGLQVPGWILHPTL